ncbi:small ubiquitin-related modifier domain-containing protein [Aspergillus foveolatus]|uniref:small ubiquitin-related modifier domain-containing protein n=1 Tax=Aspergillus foveolatus TaxID=210207 RepID=UPI003CCDD180
MRSYFNKPSWASRTDEDEDSEFYRRAGQVYRDIVATNISARERRANSLRSITHKRRCLSNSPHDEDVSNLRSRQEVAVKPGTPVENSRRSQPALGHSTANISITKPSWARQDSIYNEVPTVVANGSSPPTSQGSPQSRTQDMRAESTPSPSVTINGPEANVYTEGRLKGTRARDEQGITRSDRNTAYDDTVVHILITSEIANTKPLVIQRKMSQSLKEVRLAWFARQDLPKDFQSTVFLTWKGRRLFDVTTCKSLNISAYTNETSPFDEFFSDADACRVYMEAVTEEIYAARHRFSPKVVGVDPKSTGSTDSEGTEQHAKNEVILKCPGHHEYKIQVPLTTTISQVIGAFREARSISPGLAVYLAFDGDRLDPQSSLEDNEITDGDLVDVLIRQEF